MKKTVYTLLILIALHACTTDEPDTIMLRKKWKIVDTTALNEGSYWITELEILDLTELSHAGRRSANLYFQQTESKDLIKFKNSGSYFEILNLTEEKLEIGLCIRNPETEEEIMIAIISYQALDE